MFTTSPIETISLQFAAAHPRRRFPHAAHLLQRSRTNRSNLLKSLPGHLSSPSLGPLLERLLSTWLAQRPLHAHGVASTSEASWFGEREGDIGDMEEESAGTAVDVRFALTGTGCVGRPVNLVGTKGILGDREEESAGTAVDVRFALTEMGCLGRPVNLVSAKGTWAGLRDGAG